jgi:hypothetical protein
MRNVRILVAALAAITLVGCDGANPLSPKTMSPGSITRQAVAGDVVYLHLPDPAPAGTVFLIKRYTPHAEPYTCTAAGGTTTYTFVGGVTAVAPGYTTGPGTVGGSAEGISSSMALAPNTRLRVNSAAPTFCAGWVQAAVVQ